MCESGLTGKSEGSWRSWVRGKYSQNLLHKNSFKIKENRGRKEE